MKTCAKRFGMDGDALHFQRIITGITSETQFVFTHVEQHQNWTKVCVVIRLSFWFRHVFTGESADIPSMYY